MILSHPVARVAAASTRVRLKWSRTTDCVCSVQSLTPLASLLYTTLARSPPRETPRITRAVAPDQGERAFVTFGATLEHAGAFAEGQYLSIFNNNKKKTFALFIFIDCDNNK